MKPGMAESPLRQTIFEVYAPVERHLAAAKARVAPGSKPVAPLPSLDAYLMQLLGFLLEGEAVVLDLAGEATGGASTVLWGSQAWGGRLVAPGPVEGVEVETFDAGADGRSLANLPARCRDSARPLLVSLAIGEDAPEAILGRLQAIYAANPRAIVLAFPLGLVGQDPGLVDLLDWARGAGLSVAAVRDLTPSLAVARLGVLYPADDAAIPAVLKRIGRFFEGNLDALKLAALNFQLSFDVGRLKLNLKEAEARSLAIDQWGHGVEAQHKTLIAEFQKLEAWCRQLEERSREAAAGTQGSEAAAPGWESRAREAEGRPGRLFAAEVDAPAGTLRWLRRRLFPPQSLQERAGRSIKRLHRKLRGPHLAHASRQPSESR